MPDTDLDRAFDTFVLEIERAVTEPGAKQARSTLLRRRAGVAGAALLVVAVVGGIAAAQGGAGTHEPQPAPPVTRTDDTSVAGGDFYPTAAIDGHWRTRHLSQAEVRELLVATGREGVLAWWVSRPFEGRPRLTFSAAGVNGHNLSLGTDAEPYLRSLAWGSITHHRDEVVLNRHFTSRPGVKLRYTISGSRLDLDVLSSAWPERHGRSGLEQARVLYSGLPFTRFVSPGPWGN
ncbi:hypothetical protein GCM10009844_44680 [Nocardioides koreensis]|uniref:Uncharacterized protein n=1 Tax=Nocardioides koreensis TaxID=433651 RepID=A0ABP5LYB7_9ACTN